MVNLYDDLTGEERLLLDGVAAAGVTFPGVDAEQNYWLEVALSRALVQRSSQVNAWGENTLTQCLGGVSAIGLLCNLKYDLALHRSCFTTLSGCGQGGFLNSRF